MPSDSGYVISAANCGNKLDFDNDTNQSVNDDLMIRLVILTALAQIPISTFSHIWVFVRQYGVMFIIIVIITIIIIIYRKVKVSTLKHV